jgi:hypothetical protein
MFNNYGRFFSFSSLALGCHATRYLPGWYFISNLSPMGCRVVHVEHKHGNHNAFFIEIFVRAFSIATTLLRLLEKQWNYHLELFLLRISKKLQDDNSTKKTASATKKKK